MKMNILFSRKQLCMDLIYIRKWHSSMGWSIRCKQQKLVFPMKRKSADWMMLTNIENLTDKSLLKKARIHLVCHAIPIIITAEKPFLWFNLPAKGPELSLKTTQRVRKTYEGTPLTLIYMCWLCTFICFALILRNFSGWPWQRVLRKKSEAQMKKRNR